MSDKERAEFQDFARAFGWPIIANKYGDYEDLLTQSAFQAWLARAELKDGAAIAAKPGYKADETKPRMDLIAPEIQIALADILTFGAAKYDDRNWEKGMRWGRVFAALMRHLWAWWGKESADAETGKSHLWHAACCIMFLVAYEQRSIGEDDRA